MTLTNEKYVDLVEKKEEQHHKKCERVGVEYWIITLNSTIVRPLKRIGGVLCGFCRDAFPPTKTGKNERFIRLPLKLFNEIL